MKPFLEFLLEVVFAGGLLLLGLYLGHRLHGVDSEGEVGLEPGRRMVRWPAWFVVVDVETTSLDEVRGSIVSIGAVHPLTGDHFYCACRVRPEAYIDSVSMGVNGADWIEDPTLPTEGEAVAKLANWAAKRGARLIGGKNPSFDVRWLGAAWARAALPGRFPFTHRTIDLHALVLAWALVERPQLVMAEGFRTDDLYAALDLPPEPKPHHALTGARMEADAFRVILERGGVL